MPPPTPAALIERLERERSRGQSWRARELAQQYPTILYDRALWLLCGETLLETHDPERAGRLLFLAGSDERNHAEAISLYLARNEAHAIRRHLRPLPSLDVLEPSVRHALAERGIVELPTARPTRSAPHRLGDVIAAGLAVAVVILLVLGAGTVYRWLTG